MAVTYVADITTHTYIYLVQVAEFQQAQPIQMVEFQCLSTTYKYIIMIY